MYWVNYLVQMATISATALASWSVGENQSDSVRGLALPGSYKFFFSAAQMRGNTLLLYGARQMPLMFHSVAVLQLTAFSGTMNRKNLTNTVFGAWFYAFQLTSSLIISVLDYMHLPWINFIIVGALTCNAIILRLGPRLPKPFDVIQSKYVMWTIIAALAQFLRPNEDGTMREGGPTEEQIKIYAGVSLVVMLMVARWKSAQYPPVTVPRHLEKFLFPWQREVVKVE